MAQGVAGDLGMDVEMTEGCPKGNIESTLQSLLLLILNTTLKMVLAFK